jgi:hypothetical protein
VALVTLIWVMWLAATYIRRRDSAATMSVTYRLVARALSAVDMQGLAGDERCGLEVEHPRDDVVDVPSRPRGCKPASAA